MKVLFLATSLALVACGGQAAGVDAVAPAVGQGPATEGPRDCTWTGGFDVRVCRYELHELVELKEDAAVEVRGHLVRGPAGMRALSRSPDGSGGVPIMRIDREHAERWYLDALEGRPVVVRGHYRPGQGALDVLSLRWVREEGRELPAFAPPGQRRRPPTGLIDPPQP